MPNVLKVLMLSAALTIIAAGAIADNSKRSSSSDDSFFSGRTSRAIGGSDDKNNATLDRHSYSTDRNNERRDRNDYKDYPNDPERYPGKMRNRRLNDEQGGYNRSSDRAGDRSGARQTRSRSTELNASQVRNIQENLRGRGYDVSVDGVWGPNTSEALRRFQDDNNINETPNSIGSNTLNALNVDMNNHAWRDNSAY